jgi:hypothetical protein
VQLTGGYAFHQVALHLHHRRNLAAGGSETDVRGRSRPSLARRVFSFLSQRKQPSDGVSAVRLGPHKVRRPFHLTTVRCGGSGGSKMYCYINGNQLNEYIIEVAATSATTVTPLPHMAGKHHGIEFDWEKLAALANWARQTAANSRYYVRSIVCIIATAYRSARTPPMRIHLSGLALTK